MKRFSIATLMTVVLVCGVAVAALKYATETWAGVLASITLPGLAVALVGIVQRRGAKRAFWQGFAIFGWGYLALAMMPGMACPNCGYKAGSWSLPTDHWLDDLYARIHPPVDAKVFLTYALSRLEMSPDPRPVEQLRRTYLDVTGTPPPADVVREFVDRTGSPKAAAQVPDRAAFRRIGHCVLALLAAFLGGLIARWFHRTNAVNDRTEGSPA